MHYLNHAACGPMSDVTLQAVNRYLSAEQKFGGYGAAKNLQQEIPDGYKKLHLQSMRTQQKLRCPSAEAISTASSAGLLPVHAESSTEAHFLSPHTLN